MMTYRVFIKNLIEVDVVVMNYKRESRRCSQSASAIMQTGKGAELKYQNLQLAYHWKELDIAQICPWGLASAKEY